MQRITEQDLFLQAYARQLNNSGLFFSIVFDAPLHSEISSDNRNSYKSPQFQP
jgi:hypothetical protein